MRPPLEVLAQHTLDAPTLQEYFHIKEHPERSPLVVTFVAAPTFQVRLDKFGKPAIVKSAAEVSAGDPVFEFRSITFQSDAARVEFAYKVEGIVGTAFHQHMPDGRWALTRLELAER